MVEVPFDEVTKSLCFAFLIDRIPNHNPFDLFSHNDFSDFSEYRVVLEKTIGSLPILAISDYCFVGFHGLYFTICEGDSCVFSTDIEAHYFRMIINFLNLSYF